MSTGKFIAVEKAEYVGKYKISFVFNDGKINIVDFESFIANSRHPAVQKYRDLELFKAFKLEYGEVNWNDYDLVFPIFDLYHNKKIK